jgi:SAM-dependent methyltransferase
MIVLTAELMALRPRDLSFGIEAAFPQHRACWARILGLLRFIPMVKNWLCRIDRHGCVQCGCRHFEQNRAICDSLASTWELSVKERRWFDEREGNTCHGCGMSKRVRMLLWSIEKILPNRQDLRVLHLNQINHLSPALQRMGDVVETVYQSQHQSGLTINGYRSEDICRLSFSAEQFDLVVHSETLEHVSDYRRALEEVHRVLRPGGYQAYTIPLLHQRNTRQRIARFQDDGAPEHLLPPSYHGNEGEYPVVWEFGIDFLRQRQGQIEQIHYDNYWKNKSIFTLIEGKERRSE